MQNIGHFKSLYLFFAYLIASGGSLSCSNVYRYMIHVYELRFAVAVSIILWLEKKIKVKSRRFPGLKVCKRHYLLYTVGWEG